MVFGKRDRRPGLESRNLRHRRRVPRDDHDEVVAVVFHALQQCRDGFGAEVVIAVGHERVRLVDEQDAASGVVAGLVHLRSRSARRSPRRAPSGRSRRGGPSRRPEHLVEPRQQAGHRRLAGARVADEHEVQAAVDDRQLALAPEVLDAHEVGEQAHLCLHRFEADEHVELREQRLERVLGLLGRAACCPRRSPRSAGRSISAALMRRSIIARSVSTARSSSRVGVVSIAHTASATRIAAS